MDYCNDIRFIAKAFLSSDNSETISFSLNSLLGFSINKAILKVILTSLPDIIVKCAKLIPNWKAVDLMINTSAFLITEHPIYENDLKQFDELFIKELLELMEKHKIREISQAISNILNYLPVVASVETIVCDFIKPILKGIIDKSVDPILLCTLTAKFSQVRRNLCSNVLLNELFLQTLANYHEPSLKFCAATAKNCCFDPDLHDHILSTNEFIIKLTLPLLDSCYKISKEENDKLPAELQFIEPNLKCIENRETRRLLLDALFLLCAGPKGRSTIRNMNIYYILREYFDIEDDNDTKESCLNLINVIISDEPSKEEHMNLLNIDTSAVFAQ
ncbi:hypothetical protein GJ496_007907 [Pomphorhynchus laevis]|nr:hypothetical protein GJ496_007907 [Pomphorhynchus laevis]